ncbi:MAG: hypothetical protein V4613_04565 [Bacteroidota bacterium]
MKNLNKIILLAVVLLLLPSCMVNKCRYSSGWKIDIGSGRQTKDVEPINKQARVAKKVNRESNAISINSTSTVVTAATHSDTFAKIQRKPLAIGASLKKIYKKKHTPLVKKITNRSADKSTVSHATKKTTTTKVQSDDFLDFMGVMGLALLIGIACIAGAVGLAVVLLQGSAILEIIGMIITIILLLAGCNI